MAWFDPTLFAAAWFDTAFAPNAPKPWFDDDFADALPAGGGGGTGLLDFTLYPSTSFDAIPELTLRAGPSGKMSVRSDGKPKQIATGTGTFVAYSLARGVETVESVTFLSSTFFGQGGMILRFDWAGGDVTGYGCAPAGSSTVYRVSKVINNVSTGFGSTDFQDFTFPNDTDPITFTVEDTATGGGQTEIKAYQNGVQVGTTFVDNSGTRLSLASYPSAAYGIFNYDSAYDPSMPLTYVSTGYEAAGTVYDESVALAAHLFVAKASALTTAGGASLNAVGGFSAASALTTAGVATLNAVSGLSGSSALTTAGSLSLNTAGGLVAAASLATSGSLTLNAVEGLSAASVLTAIGALSLNAVEGITAEAALTTAGALALAVGAATSADGLLTMDAALSLATSAGYSDAGPITANAVAELAVILSLAAESDLVGGAQTYDEALSLGVAAFAAMASQRGTSADLALGAGLAIGIQAALTLAGALSLDANAQISADGQRNITGSIALAAQLDAQTLASAVLASGLSFEAVFDQAASANLDADAAIALAVQAAIEVGIITGNHVVGVTELAGGITRTIDLSGVDASRIVLGAGAAERIVLSGASAKRTGLAGSFTITIRLNGRLN